MKVDQKTVMWGLIGIGGAYVLGKVIVKDAAGEVGNAASKVGQAINPVNPDNIFYRGVNSVGAALTGRDNFNLGSWTYDLLNPDQVAALETPPTIRNQPPAEASTTPTFRYQVGVKPGSRAPVTKEETGFFDYITGIFK